MPDSRVFIAPPYIHRYPFRFADPVSGVEFDCVASIIIHRQSELDESGMPQFTTFPEDHLVMVRGLEEFSPEEGTRVLSAAIFYFMNNGLLQQRALDDAISEALLR